MVYYEPRPSGQTTHVLSLAQGLANRHYGVTAALPTHLQSSFAPLRQAGVEVVPLPLDKVLWGRQAVTGLARLIRQQDFDIVHVHSQEAGILGRIVARLAGARVIIYTPQTIDIRRARWHWLYRLIEQALASITNRIIAVNDLDRERLIRWGISPRKVVIIPNGVDLRSFNGPVDPASMRCDLGLDRVRPLVMQVGRLSAQKNPLAFVDGAAQVVRLLPDVQFALIGEGPLRDALAKRIRELGLDGKVHLLGWRDEAFRLMAAADVVTLTSHWEGAPYSLLEAMASSRPVVATAINGCLGIVEDGITGFLVPPDDAEAWVDRVTALLDDPVQAAVMGQQGRKRVEERYTLEEMISHIERLYSSSQKG